MIYAIRAELEQGLGLLSEAEEALTSGAIDAGRLSRLEHLSASTDAMMILRRQPAYRERFAAALAGLEDYKARHPVIIAPAASGIITPASYKGLVFEPKAPREGGNPKKDKILYTFDKHNERLAKAGLRGPLPSEVFSLLADNLEGKLNGDLKSAADDMMLSYGEWLALAEKRQKNDLIVYVNPRGLIWDGSKYVEDNFSCDSEIKFDIAGIPSREWVDLKRFKDDFVKWFYSKSFDELPKEMREGGRRVQVFLSSEGVLWPVGRYDLFNGWFCIVGCDYYDRASRGVRSEP